MTGKARLAGVVEIWYWHVRSGTPTRPGMIPAEGAENHDQDQGWCPPTTGVDGGLGGDGRERRGFRLHRGQRLALCGAGSSHVTGLLGPLPAALAWPRR